MNPTEQRLHDLLQEAVPEVSSVPLSAVAVRVRRRRALSMTCSALAVVAVAAAALLLNPAGHGRVVPAGQPSHRAVRADQQVAFSGVSFALPDGWTVGFRRCGAPPEHGLVLEGDRGFSCPAAPPPGVVTTSVGLATLHGPRRALGWVGRPIRWKGQPAWIRAQRVEGGTVWTLTLPLLNTAVTAQAPDSNVARALLDRITWTLGSNLKVPASASTIQVQSLAGRDGDGVTRSTTLTAAGDVRQLLSDLSALRVLPIGSAACGPDYTPQMAVLTVRRTDGTEHSFLARFAQCHQVITDTGRAAATDERLLSDIRRLLPTSGLKTPA